MKCRYFIELSYDGTNYHGWQIQPGGISIQSVLNKALSIVLKEDIETLGAGRTDAGVHAKYYIAHFDSEHPDLADKARILLNINGVLPEDIAVHKIYNVHPENHARFDAISRTYQYFICRLKDPFWLKHSYYLYGHIDVDRMNKASEILFEYTDFTSFSKLHSDVKTNNCKIYKAVWNEDGHILTFTIKADRFLRNMVRAIVGTMIKVGYGKISNDQFRSIIENRNRNKAGQSIPAKGLFLVNIEYPYQF